MNEWINVKNSLPKNDEEVLMYCQCEDRKVILAGYFIKIFDYPIGSFVVNIPSLKFHPEIKKEGFDYSYWEICKQDIYNNVTHWMPLPEPPK